MTLSIAAQTIVRRKQSDLIDNTTYCHTKYCSVMALTMTLNLAEYYLRLVSIPEVHIDLVSTS